MIRKISRKTELCIAITSSSSGPLINGYWQAELVDTSHPFNGQYITFPRVRSQYPSINYVELTTNMTDATAWYPRRNAATGAWQLQARLDSTTFIVGMIVNFDESVPDAPRPAYLGFAGKPYFFDSGVYGAMMFNYSNETFTGNQYYAPRERSGLWACNGTNTNPRNYIAFAPPEGNNAVNNNAGCQVVSRYRVINAPNSTLASQASGFWRAQMVNSSSVWEGYYVSWPDYDANSAQMSALMMRSSITDATSWSPILNSTNGGWRQQMIVNDTVYTTGLSLVYADLDPDYDKEHFYAIAGREQDFRPGTYDITYFNFADGYFTGNANLAPRGRSGIFVCNGTELFPGGYLAFAPPGGNMAVNGSTGCDEVWRFELV